MKQKEIIKKIEKIGTERNLCVSSGTVWDYDQLKRVLESNDRQNEIIKAEITKGFEPGKQSYHYIIFKYPPIDKIKHSL